MDVSEQTMVLHIFPQVGDAYFVSFVSLLLLRHLFYPDFEDERGLFEPLRTNKSTVSTYLSSSTQSLILPIQAWVREQVDIPQRLVNSGCLANLSDFNKSTLQKRYYNVDVEYEHNLQNGRSSFSFG